MESFVKCDKCGDCYLPEFTEKVTVEDIKDTRLVIWCKYCIEAAKKRSVVKFKKKEMEVD